MFVVQLLDEPIQIPVASGLVILTHTRRMLQVDPAFDPPLKIIDHDGYLQDGKFMDWGDARIQVLDSQSYTDLLANTKSGRKAGHFRTEDVLLAIEKRNSEKAKEKIDDSKEVK